MAQTNDFLTYVTAYYVTYLALCAVLIFWVAQTLHRSGSVFLNDAFHGDASLIRSVTHLLNVGFYLICVGYVLLTVRNYTWLQNLDQVFQSEIYKLGFFLLLLGAIHLFNLLLLAIFRRRGPSGVPISH